MRKEAGYEVMDHIQVLLGENDRIASIARKNEEIIAGKVLADKMSAGEADAVSGDWYVKEWNVNGETVKIGICR